MAGPNQTGSTLQSPVSEALGYGNSLMNQVSDEEKEKKRKAMQASGMGQQPVLPSLSSYLGYPNG